MLLSCRELGENGNMKGFSIRGKTARKRAENHRSVLDNSEINLSSCIDVTFPARTREAGPTKSNVMFRFMTAVKVFKHFLPFDGFSKEPGPFG